MNSSHSPTRREGFLLEVMGDELVIYYPTTEVILALNNSAGLVWILCDGTHTVDEITQVLCSAFPEAKDRIPAEVTETLAQLAENGAVLLRAEAELAAQPQGPPPARG